MSVGRETVWGRPLWFILPLSLVLIAPFFVGSLVCEAASYAVSISVTPEKYANVGDLVTHVFTIANQGTNGDVYALELTVPEDWVSLPIPGSLSVLAGQTGVVFVNLSVPKTAEAGTYTIPLKATSSSDPTVWEQATARVQVRSSWEFELEWVHVPPRGRPGERLQGSFKVTNTGNAPDEYRVELAITPDWEAGVVFEEFGLLPGEARIVEFYVVVPSTATSETQYAVTLTVTSIQNPPLKQTLTTTGRLAPPPPYLVGGTLFPEWTMAAAFAIDQEADPRFTLRGWGDIEGFGYLDASAGLTIVGIENARVWLDTGEWSVYLDGGTIVGPFLGVSGSPLFGGRIGELGTWRLLFTEERKGFSGLWRNDTSSLRVALGSDSIRELAFQEIDLRHDFEGPFSGRALIARGVQTESGIAFSLSGEVALEDLEVGGSYLSVGTGYPNQSPRNEWQVHGSYDGCFFPVDSSWSFVRRLTGTAPDEYHVAAHTFRISASVISLDAFSSNLSLQFATQQSDDTPKSTDECSYSFACSLTGDVPLPWSFSTNFRWMHDRVTGTTTSSQQVVVGGEITFGEINAVPSLSIQMLQGATGTTTSSSFSAVLSDPSLPASPQVTFSVEGGKAGLEVELTWTLAPDTEISWTWKSSLCGDPAFSTQITLRFPAVFPFCGPTKGRISGYAVIDANGNNLRDPDEQGVEGVLLLADDKEAITGSDGRFVFPPFAPGTYELAVRDLPTGLSPGIPLPIEVTISAGEEPEILIPLRPQSWIKGRVFNDRNRNGQREAEERGISSVQAFIRGEGFERASRTDASGRFILEVPPATYTVGIDEVSLPERFEMTTPTTVEVEIPEYGTVEVEFGAYQRPRPVVITFGPPTARFSAVPKEPVVGDTLTLDASESTAINAVIVLYKWEITIGEQSITGSGKRVEVILDRSGSWKVKLTVTDSNGLKAVTERVVEVQP